MRWLADAAQDLRHAVRRLRRHPGTTAVAVLSLSLGVGANTAVFTVIDALMLRSLPVAHPDELAVLLRAFPGRGVADTIAYPSFESVRDAGVFESLTASATVERSGVVLNGASDAESVRFGLVSGTYFSTLGVRAALGRVLTAEDDDSRAGVAVLSDRCWRGQFAAATDVLGRTIVVSGITVTIVGVAAAPYAGEDLSEPIDAWLPISLQPAILPERQNLLQNTASSWVRAIGRLKHGQTFAQAEAQARALFARLPAGNSPFGTPRLDVGPAGRGFAPQRESLGAPLVVLGVVVGLVLLVACGNVAMLLLARAASDRKSLAVRLAIGASRGRVMRQFLAEGLLLSALAGAAGFVAGVWVTRLLIALAQSGRAPFNLDVHPDARMLAITMATSVGTAVFVGLVPAIRATGLQLTSVLTESRATSADVAGVRLNGGRALVVTQVAISMALLIAAGLFARTLRNLESQDVGFGRDNVWMFWMAPIEAGRQGASLATLFGAAQDRVSVIPGVVSASPSTDCVMSGFIGLRSVSVAGRTPAADEDVNAQWNLVGPRFFGTMGMRLVAGRDFNPLDTDTSARVAVVNQTMAQHFFGDADPIGRTFGFGRDLAQPIEIVGVVADAKYYYARDPKVPMVFLPYRQDVTHIFRMCLAVRLTDSSPATIDRIRGELRAIDPGVPLRLVNTTDDQLSRSLAEERLTAWLAGSFSLLALLLACMGLFGVMSYMVARRTREIGVRIALGESRGGILRRVLRESLTLVGVGLIPGAIAAVIGGRFVQTLLFGVTPADPATMVEAALALASVAVLAAVIPARRAASVDPTVALRAY